MVKLIDPVKRKYTIQFWWSGKCYRRIVSGDKRLATELEARMRAELSQGSYFPERAKVSFDEVADKFLSEYAVHTKSGKKMAIYLRRAKTFFAGKQAGAINPEDIQAFRQELALTMCQVSVNHYHRAIRRAYNWAIDRKLYRGENPASGKKVKFTNERKYWRTRFLSSDEYRKLVECADEGLKEIITCAVLTGLRKGELKSLRKKDCDLDKCQVFVQDSKTGESGYVPYCDTLFPILDAATKRCPDPELPVFSFSNFERRWERARLKAGLGDVHFHDLRHTFASHLIQNTNGDLKAVQDLMRHKDVRMTMRYAHLSPGYLRQATLTLDRTFGNLGGTAAPQVPLAGAPVPSTDVTALSKHHMI